MSQGRIQKQGKAEINSDGAVINNRYIYDLSRQMDNLEYDLKKLHQSKSNAEKIKYYSHARQIVANFKHDYLFSMAKYE